MTSDRIGVQDRSTRRVMPLVTGDDPVEDSTGSPWPGIKMEHYHTEGFRTPPATIMNFLVLLCLSADPDATLGPPDNRVALQPDDMITVSPGTLPGLESSGKLEFLLLEMAPMYFMWAAEELDTGKQFRPTQCQPFRDDQLRHVVLAMHHELLAGFPAGRLFGEYMGLSFATTLLTRQFGTSRRSGGYRGGLSPAKLRLVKTFVADHLANSLSLTEMARLVQMGPSHFAQTFKESTGLSPHQYVLRRRIDRAVEMLKDEHSSLAGIAYDLGFSSQGHFTTVFRKFTGTQPSNYREQLLSLKQINMTPGPQSASGSFSS